MSPQTTDRRKAKCTRQNDKVANLFLPVTSGSNLLFPLDIPAHRYPHLVRRKWCPRVQHSRSTVRTHLHVADFNSSFPLELKGHPTLQRRTTLLVALRIPLMTSRLAILPQSRSSPSSQNYLSWSTKPFGITSAGGGGEDAQEGHDEPRFTQGA